MTYEYISGGKQSINPENIEKSCKNIESNANAYYHKVSVNSLI